MVDTVCSEQATDELLELPRRGDLSITTFLDRIPRLARVELGKRIMEKCRLAYEQGRHRYATFATSSGPLVFVSDPADRQDRVRYLQSITGMVHTKALDEGAEDDIQTLGVATEPFPNDGRSHDFCLMSGRFDLTDAAQKTRDDLWNATFTAPRMVDESVLTRLLD